MPAKNKPMSGRDSLIDEATKQVAAANGVPIEWRVSDPGFAAVMQRELDRAQLSGILVRYFP